MRKNLYPSPQVPFRGIRYPAHVSGSTPWRGAGQELTMKIGPLEAKPVTPANAPAGERKVGAAPSGAPAPTEASATVQLSPSASLLVSAAAVDPTFDAGKVEAIASAIREGRFKIDAEAIADKLIVNAEELLGRKLS
jgi:negative regulator of flagellin synthesis FlgM